jgi:hypothetical protein
MTVQERGRPNRHARRAGLLLTVSLVVAACGDDSDDETTPDPPTGEEEAGEGAERNVTDGDGGDDTPPGTVPVDGDPTPPGTELSFGDTAVVPVQPASGDDAVISITVYGIEEYDRATAEETIVNIGEHPEGAVAYVARVDVGIVEPPEDADDISFDTVGLERILADGDDGILSLATGSVDGCNWGPVPTTESGPHERCLVWAETADNPPVQIIFSGDRPGSEYEGGPIVWSG